MFALKGSVSAELASFKSLVASDLARSRQVYADGEKLIVLAGNGQYAQFKRFVNEVDPTSILAYFSAKALMASLIGGHLMLSTYMLDNGYPIHVTGGLPNLVHDCLRELTDDECVPIVRLFASKGYDVNTQERETWLSPLHISVSRELVDTMHALLDAGADVNIVGANDAMPLSLAHALPADSPARQQIIHELTKRGGKLTWRKESTGSLSGSAAGNTFSTPYASNTEVRVGGNRNAAMSSQPALSAQPRVRFNGAQLDTSTPSSGMVRFNGASMQLHPVPATTRTTVTGASEGSLPPAPPKVSVSTASGERLLPPPRVRQDGAVAEAGAEAVEGEHDAAAQHASGEVQGDAVDQEMVESLAEMAVEANDSRTACPTALVGSFHISDDGAAMLFSTG